jgi:hypothetical protein
MKILAIVLSLLPLAWQAAAQQQFPPPVPPQWAKYTLTAISNGTNGCVNANGCWQVNGVRGANKAAALTQNVTLFVLPANGHVVAYRIKTATACTGPTTLVTGLGTTGSTGLYLAASPGYNLKTAVSATNVTTGAPSAVGSDTAASTSIVASLTATVSNVDQTVAGCSADFHLLWGVLP